MSDEPKFYCETCKKSFAHNSALMKHYKTASHLQNEENKKTEDKILEIKTSKGKSKVQSSFYCPLCDYEIQSKDNFKKHLKTVVHNKNYDIYEEEITKRNDYDELQKLLSDLSESKIKLGLVKDGNKYKEVSVEDIDDLFNIDEIPKLKKTKIYPTNIKHIKKEESGIIEEKKKTKKEKLNELIESGKQQIKQMEKAQEKYLKTKNPEDMNYNLRRLVILKKNLKTNLEKLENLEK
jgi:hypothetical protein